VKNFNLIYGLLIVALPASLSAQNASSAGLPFLKIGVDAASNSMGGAVVSSTAGAAAAYWNPAGLMSTSRMDFVFSHQNWISGSSNQYVGLGIPREDFSYGISIALSDAGEIERRDDRPTTEPLGYFGANSIAIGFSAATSFASGLKIGASTKVLYEKIYTYTANGVAFDIGFMKDLNFFNLSSAVVLKDIGSMSTLNNESTPLPSRIIAGISGSSDLSDTISLALALNAGKYLDAKNFFRIGGDFTLKRMLNIRAGYRVNSENSSGLTAGIGIMLNRYSFDYAYLPFDFNLGDTHQLSLRILM